ncbi:MAG TPA: SH3 domain-containing protein [Candidatus Binatia bacterium]|nr:SH3 domain-containing protein [Candidatus Binatia bacterium]
MAGTSGAYLYSRQDEESSPIAKLEKGERLVPLIEAIGQQVWYMVKTQGGLTGWVRAVDVTATAQVKEVFKEATEDPSLSTWSARTSSGRTFDGTWTINPGSSATAVSGTWTLSDPTGKTNLRGTWTAEKFATGWQGVWRAVVDGRSGDYAGSWTAAFDAAHDASFIELFEASVKDAIRGLWSAGGQSGSWTLRAANRKEK